MKTTKTLISLLFMSAVSIVPASANWFSNPRTNTNLNIGSAPNPTPADLRAVGDSHFVRPAALTYNGARTHAYVASRHSQPMRTAQLNNMEGRPVFGSHDEHLGYILAVDYDSQLIELQTPRGVAVSMPASLLVDKRGRVVAPTMSRADVMAMAKTQTGRTVAINIDRRNHAFRG